MIQRLLITLLLVTGSLAGWAQTPCSNIEFTTQQQVDDFAATGCSNVNGSLSIRGNLSGEPGGITNLQPLSTIKFVRDNVTLTLNRLASIKGLENITRIGGDLTITGATVLTELDQNSFSSLETVDGSVTISNGNPSLTSISGFSNLRLVNRIEIGRNTALKDLTGFNAVPTLPILLIGECGSLQSISGFSSLKTTEILDISRNKSLMQINGFTALKESGGLVIVHNKSLTEISGFNALKSARSLRIQSDSSLTSISGFNGDLVVRSIIDIGFNPVLQSITGFNGLSAPDVILMRNETLPDIQGFGRSKIINLEITFHKNLQAISGFDKAEITEFINVLNNDQLSSITGFGGVASPNYIILENNTALQTITGAFAYSDYSPLKLLRLVNNSTLAACTQPWICRYLSRGGDANISGNAASCTPTAIAAGCSVLATPEPVALQPTTYPNPVLDVLYLSSPASFRLYDLVGRVVMQGKGAQLSVAALPAGVYVLETERETKQSVRIIKQ